MRSQTTTTSNGGDENGNDVVADVANVADIDIPCLSVEEEYLTLQNNMEIMGQLCDRLEFSRQTEATAMIYFKRFFLYHSIMQFDPRIFMYATQIFLSFFACFLLLNVCFVVVCYLCVDCVLLMVLLYVFVCLLYDDMVLCCAMLWYALVCCAVTG